ncbi:MAG: TonB-dependent receptor [Betaproteobacteria bacterium]|nr:TonB-dependent receptor [Betaproteobacteria bacterium]
MKFHRWRGIARASFPLALWLHGLALAQTPSSASQAVALPAVTITGNPLQTDPGATPVLVLQGEGLWLRQGATLGETLDGTPGVSSTGFGPNASRPIIRGLDGDRIRILSNGGATIDASGLSYDHAVPVDPVVVERIEVLRGPAALLYGGNAIGGVVNLIDNRIPVERLQGPVGRAQLGWNSGDRARSAAAMIESGNDRFAVHVDAFDRIQSDLRVPRELACQRGGVPVLARQVCNSSARAQGGAAGASAFFASGRIGGAVSEYRSDYGTVAQDDVRIGLRSSRVMLDGEWRDLLPGLQRLRWQWGRTDYAHAEFESGVAGTRFANQGSDWRVEARHAEWLGWQGVIGLQGDANRFAADGEEAFAPYSRTRQQALFAHQERALPWARISAGLRLEQVRVESLGHPLLERFVAASRSFQPRSAALGARGAWGTHWQWHAQLAHSERAPRDYELFANGPHVATAAYEIGNPALQTERARHAEWGLEWKSGAHAARWHVFDSRFANYIALDARSDAPGATDASPLYAYRALPARLTGTEASGVWRLREGTQTLDWEWRLDTVHARHAQTGEPLPRIAPARAGSTLVWREGPWAWRVGFDHAAQASRVPAGQQVTPGYTLWHAALNWRLATAGGVLWDAFARLNNATDRLAYSATSILTQTAPGRSPLPGRSLRLGLQARF